MSRVKKLVVIVLVVMAVAAVVVGVKMYDAFFGGNEFPSGGEKVLYVSKGQSFASIVDSLESHGMIRDRGLFIFVARMFGGTNKIHVGKYNFTSGISNTDLYLSLREGKGISPITVTLQEGLLARTQARLLSRAVGIDSATYVNLVYNEDFTRSLGIDAVSLEGYLLPETYFFGWQPDEKEVIMRLVSHFKQFYTDSLRKKARAMGWTDHELMTFASIVEGEAVLDEERKTIAGVYHNRLKKGMRLEADPTIQYFVPNGPRRLLYSDLKTKNPYNTYMYAGLPPGPVNNPGKASILASLFPEKNNFIFFVANGKGGHWFSSNYSDHLNQVRKYRRGRAAAQRNPAAMSRKKEEASTVRQGL